MEFKEFPEGDAFYVVKWIDRYAPTAPKSAAMSVDVVLQRLPQTSLREIQWLSGKQVRDLLGKPGADAPDPIDPRDPYKHKRWPSLTRRCHAGLLPKVHIGDVFHKCLPVGALPQREFSLFLPGGSATGDNYTLRQAMTGPGWRKVGRPRTILGPYQYELPWGAMERSQVLVVKQDNTEFVVPHNVIFRGFYAVNTDLARAFTEGLWELKRHTVVRPEGEMMENGLCTRRDAEDRLWTVILRADVPFGCERIAAILYHDAQAKAHANAIYAFAEQSRKESRGLARHPRWSDPREWYVTAKVPFDDCALKLTVHGMPLREGTLQDGTVLRQVLVTRIVGCNEPPHIPTIEFERENSGEGSANPTVSDEPKPYSGSWRGQDKARAPRQDTQVTSQEDADRSGALHRVDGGEFVWEDAKEMHKMTKATSTHYTGLGSPKPPRPPTGVVSAGFVMPGDARQVDPLVAETLVRVPSRLKLIWWAFERLEQARKIISVRIIPPAEPIARAGRGVFECWNLLDADERAEVVKPPTRDWRVIERIGGWPVLRAVLVCQVQHEKGSCVWFEIECRPSEKRCSLLVAPAVNPSDALIYDCLSTIAHTRGHNLADSLSDVAAEHGVVATDYVHKVAKMADEEATVEDDEDAQFRQLNDTSVLNAIVRVLDSR